MKKILPVIIFFLYFLADINGLTFRTKDFDKGPLIGKNTFIPYFIYLNYPGFRAKTGEKYELYYHTSIYFTNEFIAPYRYTKFPYELIRAVDYESLIFEFSLSFNILKNLQVIMNTRLVYYYGGFLDDIIQNFHYGFGFPNASRHFFNQYEVMINIENGSNVDLKLNKPALSFGDIDLWIKYTLIQKKIISIAFTAGLKIPSGSLKSLSGSGYPDIGFGMLVDFTPVRFISFYLQSCLIIPMDAIIQTVRSKPAVMVQNIISLSINPFKNLSIVVQLNTKTPALEHSEKLDNGEYSGNYFLFYPQVDILAGLIATFKDFKLQFYFEENPIYLAGPDLTINFLVSHKINFK